MKKMYLKTDEKNTLISHHYRILIGTEALNVVETKTTIVSSVVDDDFDKLKARRSSLIKKKREKKTFQRKCRQQVRGEERWEILFFSSLLQWHNSRCQANNNNSPTHISFHFTLTRSVASCALSLEIVSYHSIVTMHSVSGTFFLRRRWTSIQRVKRLYL